MLSFEDHENGEYDSGTSLQKTKKLTTEDIVILRDYVRLCNQLDLES